MTLTFDFDTVARKPQIISENLDVIREHFSVEDKALVFMRKRIGRNIPVENTLLPTKDILTCLSTNRYV